MPKIVCSYPAAFDISKATYREKIFVTRSNTLKATFKSHRYGRGKGFECTVRSVRSNTDSTDFSTGATDQTTAAPVTTKQPTTAGYQCGVANPNRIVGGTEYVITASHCFFDRHGNRISDEGLVVGVANHDMYSSSDDVSGVTRLVSVAKVILHLDIALLKLSETLDLSKNKELRSVCLPADDSKTTYAGALGIAAGWGNLESEGSQPDKLIEVTLPILEPSCWDRTVSERMLCAGYKEGGKDTCQGDSGGPLYVVEDSKYFQVGITSFGNGCANPNSPGVYARVSKFLSWIKTNTADATYC
ncbi:trypsin-1-like [Penaeus chinensis]|uniref:trypsin-1-like n=1 Tax=Penaeus chinensis TaxID=139456 RepID=UPI001FB80C60|nr:trypsin-1-like [Penaeus chinensis]